MSDAGLGRFILKSLLSLPKPLLRAFAGSRPAAGGERVLDPRFEALAAAARRLPRPAVMTPEFLRAASSAGREHTAGEPEPGVAISSLTIEGPRGAVPLRAYRPENQDPAAPLLVFAHFGGGVIGDLETCHVFCTILAEAARCAVLSVDYRLAPEHPFPAGLEDVLTSYRWAREHADEFGAPAGAVAIGGDSMGGNFAAVIAQEMKRAGEPQPVLQLLIYPAVDLASETQSMTTYADAFPLSSALMEWFAAQYLAGSGADAADPRASPLHAEDLSGLAPAVVVTAGFDPLVDQGEAYAKRLRDAGVHVVYRCYDHLAHAFTAYTGAVPAAAVACREIAGLLREGFEGRIP